MKFKAGNIAVSTKSAGFATEYAANKIAEGFRPQLYRRPSGKQGLVFQPRPAKPRPAIYLVLKMRMASYLGDYGAGQTLSTFSLLPGEKTVIQIRDYRHNETTQATSESVLDSYSESAMEDLQTTVEESSGQTTRVERDRHGHDGSSCRRRSRNQPRHRQAGRRGRRRGVQRQHHAPRR